jgi:hypothetical protein
VGRVEQRRKLARLEARASATRTVLSDLAEARKARLLAEAVGRLSDADLIVVGEIVDAALAQLDGEAREPSEAANTDLHAFAATARERQALAALELALAEAVAAREPSEADERSLKHA